MDSLIKDLKKMNLSDENYFGDDLIVHEAKLIFSRNMCKLVNNICIAYLNPNVM